MRRVATQLALIMTFSCSSKDTNSPVSPDAARLPPDGSLLDAAMSDVATPPVNMGSCDHLPAKGTWEKVVPAGLPDDFAAIGLAVDSANLGTVYVGTSVTVDGNAKGSGLWKSLDCGAT
jgi:hypothetical protein